MKNYCKQCGKETTNEKFCSRYCQRVFNMQGIINKNVQFKCQKHNYSKVIHISKLKITTCPQCQHEKQVEYIKDKVCQNCGEPLKQYYGTGRFCSRSCANSKSHSEQTIKKIRQGVINNIKSKKPHLKD